MKKALVMEGVLTANSREELEHKFTMLALDLLKQMPEEGIVRLALGMLVRGMMQESGHTQGRDAIELMQTVGVYMNDAGRERMGKLYPNAERRTTATGGGEHKKPHDRRRKHRK